MATSTVNMADIYMSELFFLSDEQKVSLATKLLNSLKGKVNSVINEKNPFAELTGAWDDGRSTEEVEADIRAHRMFNREHIEW